MARKASGVRKSLHCTIVLTYATSEYNLVTICRPTCDWAWSVGGEGSRLLVFNAFQNGNLMTIHHDNLEVWRFGDNLPPKMWLGLVAHKGELGGQSMPLTASRLPPTLKSACFWKAFPLHLDALFGFRFQLKYPMVGPVFWTFCKMFGQSKQNATLHILAE